jgi:hypothetical protein
MALSEEPFFFKTRLVRLHEEPEKEPPRPKGALILKLLLDTKDVWFD